VIRHLRINWYSPRDRRIGAIHGARIDPSTVCGAPVTSDDWADTEIYGKTPEDLAFWKVCLVCLKARALLSPREKASEGNPK
jgi:hypothetical protein